ncbi:hypothetical protein ABC255_08680 [Neobacillus sp. 3P2-tot-E-2]|uniref:hypothetical protein n=1 Tax=Neobacillus sp. 3P2-tot-E-2 TaxID=3132212 RepID=UPI0039A11BEC
MREKEDVEMATETVVRNIPRTRQDNISKALREVEMIQTGTLPKKSARDFLTQSRKK